MQRVPDRLLDLAFHKPCGERLQRLIPKVVLRVPDAEFQGINFDMHVVHLEDRRLVLASGHEGHGGLRTYTRIEIIGNDRTKILTVKPSPPTLTSASPESVNLGIPVFFLK